MSSDKNKSNELYEILFDTYKINLDIWKSQTDNYFKRVQLIYLFIEGALIVFIAGLAKQNGIFQQIIYIGIVGIGIYISRMWQKAIKRYGDYFELNRKMLRQNEDDMARYIDIYNTISVPSYYKSESTQFFIENIKKNPNINEDVKKVKLREIGLIKIDEKIAKSFFIFWIFLMSILVLLLIINILIKLNIFSSIIKCLV